VSARLAGKVAIVTGATEGIGTAVAEAFVAEGARIVAVARRAEPGEHLAARLGNSCRFVAGDVTDPGTAKSAIAEAERAFGPLDVLVNNAGVDLSGVPLLETTEAQARTVFEVNLFGAFRLMLEVARTMAGRGGAIVNVTSRLAHVGLAGSAVYGSSKGALHALSKGAAVEWAALGIRVNAVAPGLTETPMIRAWVNAHDNPDRFRSDRESSIPLGRFADPTDVAAAVVYLASDEAASVTGASIPVDGGYTAA
jgi:NAD(P)-dependent dehydrogenase (short-subunit alcohol dehydrogenase family)